MTIKNATVLANGAHRRLGLAFARKLLIRGADTIHAATRTLLTVTRSSVQPLRVDVATLDDMVAAAALASDVTLAIGYAGTARRFT